MGPSRTLCALVALLAPLTLFAAKPTPSCPALPIINPTPNACVTGHGCLDSTFGSGGLVLTNTDGAVPYTSDLDVVDAILQQSDGKLVVASTTHDQSSPATGLALLRYNIDGSLDPTFGTGGMTTLIPAATSSTSVHGAAFDGSGNIWVLIDENGPVAIARFTANGVPDTTFSPSGYIAYQNLKSSAFALQSDGKLVVVGHSTTTTTKGGTQQISVAQRFNYDGTRDTSFGSAGTVVLNLSNAVAVRLQTINSQQYILVGGASNSGDSSILRLSPAGAVDTTFGSSGQTSLNICGQGSQIGGMNFDLNGNIVTVGRGAVGPNSAYKTVVMRFTANGAVDTTFGDVSGSAHSGRTMFDYFGTTGALDAIKVDVSNNLVVGGMATKTINTSTLYRYLVTARVTPSGALDATYGVNGLTAVDYGSHEAMVLPPATNSVLIQADGSIVIGGTNTDGTIYFSALARYVP